MSQENVERIRQSFDAISRGDKAAWAAMCDPQIQAVPVGDCPEPEIRGREAVWDFLVAANEPWEPGPYDLSEIVDGGDHVAVRVQRDLRRISSGVEVAYDYWLVVTFNEGTATRLEWFATRDEALEAVGLRE
jgi:ketosteroid isomerase-like protein